MARTFLFIATQLEARMDMNATWAPLPVPYDINDNGKLDPRERRALPDTVFAFPRQRELPLVDAELTQEAVAEFAQVVDASDEERRLARANIRTAADYYGVQIDDGALGVPGVPQELPDSETT
jgi:hypothetical protein